MIATKKARTILPVLGVAIGSVASFDAIAQQPERSRPALIPHASWDCYLPAGIPSPEDGTLSVELEVPLDRAAEIGRAQFGERSVAVGLEGAVTGPKLSGTVMEGALDFELTLSNGTLEIEQTLVLQAADGSYILARNAGTGPDAGDVRIVMDFEAPNEGDHAWLNSGTYVARRELDASAGTLGLRVYDVSDVPV